MRGMTWRTMCGELYLVLLAAEVARGHEGVEHLRRRVVADGEGVERGVQREPVRRGHAGQTDRDVAAQVEFESNF